MQLSNVFTNRKGNVANLHYAKKCDLSVLTCSVLPDCVGVPNIEHIWFLKQRIVRDLYNKVKDMPGLIELWVFGSAVQERCNVYSDLDVAYRFVGDDRELFNIIGTVDPNGVDRINLDMVKPHSALSIQIRKGWRII